MEQELYNEIMLPDGSVVLMDANGDVYFQVDPTSLNGLFSKGGFFDKAIKTASGIFKKDDGTKTFIGETITNVATNAGQQIGQQIGQQGQLNNGTFQPLSQPLFQTPTSTLPPASTQSPLNSGNTDDSPLAWWKVLLGVGGIVATGFAIHYFQEKGEKA